MKKTTFFFVLFFACSFFAFGQEKKKNTTVAEKQLTKEEIEKMKMQAGEKDPYNLYSKKQNNAENKSGTSGSVQQHSVPVKNNNEEEKTTKTNNPK